MMPSGRIITLSVESSKCIRYVKGTIEDLKKIPALLLGLVVQRPINANLRLKLNQGVYFSTPKCCSTLIFGEAVTLEEVNFEKQK